MLLKKLPELRTELLQLNDLRIVNGRPSLFDIPEIYQQVSLVTEYRHNACRGLHTSKIASVYVRGYKSAVRARVNLRKSAESVQA